MNRYPAIALTGLILLATSAVVAWFADSGVNPPVTARSTSEPTWGLRLGHNTPVDSALHQASLRYAERVERKSAGRIHIEVFRAQFRRWPSVTPPFPSSLTGGSPAVRYAPAFTPERHDGLGPEDYCMARFDQDGAIIPLGGDPAAGASP